MFITYSRAKGEHNSLEFIITTAAENRSKNKTTKTTEKMTTKQFNESEREGRGRDGEKR